MKTHQKHLILTGLIIAVLLAIGFFVLMKLNATTECYQETANLSNACGGLNTGKYGFAYNVPINSSLVANIMYINYTKPINSKNAIWQVKHGGYDVYNITIPEDCWNMNNVNLRFIGGYYPATTWHTSYGECLNSTNWTRITLIRAWSGGHIECATNVPKYLYDGDWNTGSVLGTDTGGWCVYYGGEIVYGTTFEEAIIWRIKK